MTRLAAITFAFVTSGDGVTFADAGAPLLFVSIFTVYENKKLWMKPIPNQTLNAYGKTNAINYNCR